jgi:hypothetical protein
LTSVTLHTAGTVMPVITVERLPIAPPGIVHGGMGPLGGVHPIWISIGPC